MALHALRLGGCGLRLLLMAPHPDDEVLAAGGIIARAAGEGASVHVVFLTSGDGFRGGVRVTQRVLKPGAGNFLCYGRGRMEEARRALGVLGLGEKDITFLGYPDGGLERIWIEHWSSPYASPATHCSAVPYEDALSPGAPYTAASIIADLVKIMNVFRPTVLLLPHTGDTHPDHRACGVFTLAAVAARRREGGGPTPQLYGYLIHAGIWQVPPVACKKRILKPPGRFIKRGAIWYTLAVEQHHLKLKKKALSEYRTQLEIVPVFLKNFLRPNEILSGMGSSTLDGFLLGQQVHGTQTVAADYPSDRR